MVKFSSQIQNVWAQKLHVLSTKLGSCIEKSRPYYDARKKVKKKFTRNDFMQFEFPHGKIKRYTDHISNFCDFCLLIFTEILSRLEKLSWRRN